MYVKKCSVLKTNKSLNKTSNTILILSNNSKNNAVQEYILTQIYILIWLRLKIGTRDKNHFYHVPFLKNGTIV